jgi:hypothetical protein
MQSNDDAMPTEEKAAISRRDLLKALGTGIIASGGIGCTSRSDAAPAFADELTPELYYSFTTPPSEPWPPEFDPAKSLP